MMILTGRPGADLGRRPWAAIRRNRALDFDSDRRRAVSARVGEQRMTVQLAKAKKINISIYPGLLRALEEAVEEYDGHSRSSMISAILIPALVDYIRDDDIIEPLRARRPLRRAKEGNRG